MIDMAISHARFKKFGMPVEGNMSGAYFVGKAKLLEWLNDFLQETTAKVEDCSSGHQYLMCLDAIYPGQVNFLKAKYDAQLEWEKIENLKIVQQVLTANKVDRVVDVGKLAKGKLQDNLEFLQWFKHWFDQNSDHIYSFDPQVTKTKFGKKNSIADQQMQQRQQQVQQSKSYTVQRAMSNEGGQFLQPTQQKKQKQAIARSGSGPNRNINVDCNSYKVQQLELENTNLQEKILSFNQQMAKYEKTISKKNSEAQFYFNKLRQIEVYVQQMLQKYKEAGLELENEGNMYEAAKVCNHINGLLIAPYGEQQAQ